MRTSVGVAILASVLVAATASATPCPSVMIVLDKSGSMADPPSGNSGASKLSVAKTAIDSLVDGFGNTLPLGFTTFANENTSCAGGITIVVEPAHSTSASIKTAVAAVSASGETNTGQAIDKVLTDPIMTDSMRPGSFIVLITDGEPDCNGTETTGTVSDPTYTVDQIAAAAAKGVKTFVVGFGSLPSAAVTTMNKMATAGGAPCSGTTCNGKMYFAAGDATALNTALTAIEQQISGEFTTTCDDSCYSNACAGGQICVQSACAPDPCANVKCSGNEYCYTNGTSAGTCVTACTQSCASDETCVNGSCTADPCANITCDTTQACKNGACITNACGGVCATGLVCYEGACVDDPCGYVTCPNGTMCVTGSGACAGAIAGGGATGRAKVAGCTFAGAADPGSSALIVILFGGALAIFTRPPRPRS